jgi:hypothetical protein
MLIYGNCVDPNKINHNNNTNNTNNNNSTVADQFNSNSTHDTTITFIDNVGTLNLSDITKKGN